MIQPEDLSGLTLAEVQRRLSLDPLERRILICHALGLSRAQLIAQSERVLTIDDARKLSHLFDRRLAGEPIAYLTGRREFYGLDFQVTPDVLIPRPETELLVELACERVPQGGGVLDLGTGSGAIAIALAHERPDLHISATDASSAALAVARANAARLLGDSPAIRFLQGSWFDALNPSDRFDLIVSNPPYIVSGDPHLSRGDLRFEPVDALTDHADGLSAIQAIVEGARGHLTSGGWLLIEHGFDQATSVKKLLNGNLFEAVQTWKDLAGFDRVTGGKMYS